MRLCRGQAAAPSIFLAADNRLPEAAQEENLATDNLNLHP